MRLVAALLALISLVPLRPAVARPIDRDWGIGVGTGLGESGRLTPGLSVLRDHGSSHAWGVDLSLDPYGVDHLEEEDVLFRFPRLPDSLTAAPRDVRRRSVLCGLRWRAFARPREALTTFLDLHLAGTYNSVDVRSAGFHREGRRYGAETGIGFGAEWSPGGSRITLSAQSNVLTGRLEEENWRFDEPGYRGNGGEDVLTLLLELTPRVYLRAYF